MRGVEGAAAALGRAPTGRMGPWTSGIPGANGCPKMDPSYSGPAAPSEWPFHPARLVECEGWPGAAFSTSGRAAKAAPDGESCSFIGAAIVTEEVESMRAEPCETIERGEAMLDQRNSHEWDWPSNVKTREEIAGSMCVCFCLFALLATTL